MVAPLFLPRCGCCWWRWWRMWPGRGCRGGGIFVVDALRACLRRCCGISDHTSGSGKGRATRQHRTVGYVAFGLWWASSSGAAGWWQYYSKASYPSLAGLAHRSGVVVLVLVSLQYFSSRDLGAGTTGAASSKATVWTVLLSVLLLVAGYLWLRPREDGTRPILKRFYKINFRVIYLFSHCYSY